MVLRHLNATGRFSLKKQTGHSGKASQDFFRLQRMETQIRKRPSIISVMKQRKLSDPQTSVIVACSIILGMAVSLLAGGLSLIQGGSLQLWQAWLGVLVSGLTLLGLSGSFNQRLGRLTLAAICAVFSLALSAATFDLSWDGQLAHLGNILYLGHGWKPISESAAEAAQRFLPEYPALASASPSLNAPRTTHILGALLFLMTDSIETAKAVNLLAGIAAGLLVYAAFSRWHFGPWKSLTLAGLVVFNPAAVPLYLTTLVDSFLWTLTASMVALSMLLARSPNSFLLWLGWVASFVLLAPAKLTGAGFATLIGGGALALGLWSRRTGLISLLTHLQQLFHGGTRKIAFLLAALLIACLAISLQFAPKFGLTGGHSVMPYSWTELRQALFEGRSTGQITWIEQYPRPMRLWISLMSRTDTGPHAPQWKIPFSIYPKEIGIYLRLYDAPELGGFGPWAGGCFLLLLAGNAFLLVRSWPRARFFLLLQLIVLACALPLPNAIVRFIIPFWLLWILGLAGFWFCSGQSPARWLATGFAFLLIINTMLVTGPYLWGQIHVQAAYRDQLSYLSELPQPLKVDFGIYKPLEWRLRKAGLSTIPAEASPNASRILLLRTNPGEMPAQILLGSPPTEAEQRVFLEIQCLQEKLKKLGINLRVLPKNEGIN